MFYLMFILIGIILLLTVFYVCTRFHKFPFIQKVKNKFLKWFISIIPIILIVLIFNYVNALVIIFHFALFFLVSEVISFIIAKLRKNIISYYLTGIIAIVFTFVYLIYGAYQAYHVYHTYYEIITNKELGTKDFRIVQISDSHIGTTFNGEGFKKHMDNIKNLKCDIVVITGDFVDDDTEKDDMVKSIEALSLLKPKYGVYYINGNHDKGYFNYRNFTYEELKKELVENDVIVLEDEIHKINDSIYIIGRDDKSNINRKSIDELIKDIDKSKYIIDLNHQPNDYKNEMNKVDLVLSGHTHGGQLFPLGYIGIMMGANDEFYGLHKRGNTNFIVNSGISDWAIDFKTGTFSEIGIIDIHGIYGNN